MAMYDHRTFRDGVNWWVAQVHGQSGHGSGAGPHPMNAEFVLFTCLTMTETKSRSAHIPLGKLNAMSHESIVHFLQVAELFPSRIDMSPYNTPDESEYRNADHLVDDAGLKWAIRAKRVPSRGGEPLADVVVEVVCLDDSALRRDILMQTSTTLDDFRLYVGKHTAAAELVAAVRATYEHIEPDEIQRLAAASRS